MIERGSLHQGGIRRRTGDRMTLPDDQLRRLLDGEIDAGELAGDRVMASIADRVFGVKVDPASGPSSLVTRPPWDKNPEHQRPPNPRCWSRSFPVAAPPARLGCTSCSRHPTVGNARRGQAPSKGADPHRNARSGCGPCERLPRTRRIHADLRPIGPRHVWAIAQTQLARRLPYR